MKILVINCGSSSLKYQLIDMTDESVIAKGLCERIGIDGQVTCKTADGRKHAYDVDLPTHTEAFYEVKKSLIEGACKVIDSLDEIAAVGHRVVQGGALFHESCLVTDEVVSGIESLIELAPLHNMAHLQGIHGCTEVFGKNFPQVVVFDNAFHSTMPPKAYMFALPYKYYEEYKVRKYGFHGTSHRYVSNRLSEILGESLEGKKVIVCHLGNGSSLTAIQDGKVIDTSMGLTPLDGFIMGSRCGAVDPSAITYIQDLEKLTTGQMDALLNKKSGLLGISGVSSDFRDVLKARHDGNERAALAIDMFFYQITKVLGSYVAAMNGVDYICFTAGIGENSSLTRSEVCKNLTYLGVEIDEEANSTIAEEIKISTENSKVGVYVIPTNEELMIARDTMALISK